jgi:hypothetical protein
VKTPTALLKLNVAHVLWEVPELDLLYHSSKKLKPIKNVAHANIKMVRINKNNQHNWENKIISKK